MARNIGISSALRPSAPATRSPVITLNAPPTTIARNIEAMKIAAAPAVPIAPPAGARAAPVPLRVGIPIASIFSPAAPPIAQPSPASPAAPAPPSNGSGGGGDGGGDGESQRDEQEESERHDQQNQEEAQSSDSSRESEGEAESGEGESYESEEEIAEDSASDVGADFPDTPYISSHVYDGVMHTAAIVPCSTGYEAVVLKVPAYGSDQEGLVNFNGENPGWLDTAIARTTHSLAERASNEAPKKELASLVRRARAGDQNAMGIIAMVRARAQAGDPTAKRSAQLMREYVDANPPQMGSELTADDSASKNSHCAVLVLANGPALTNSKIASFQSQFGEERHQKAFLYGFHGFRSPNKYADLEKRLDPHSKSVVDIGRIIGEARAIQAVRRPKSSITKFHPLIGWELGE